MPAVYFHYTFIKENTSNKDFQSLLNLSGQGPDVFSFYGYSLKKRKNTKEVRRFGALLHHSDVSKAYYHLFEYANKNEHKDMLLTYIYGLFMHYILDRNLHPYIFYRTGFNQEGLAKKEYFLSHVAFEGYLDVKFAKKHNTVIPLKDTIITSDNYVKEVSKMFFELSNFLEYKGLDENSFYYAYKDMVLAQKILYSKHGFKKWIFNTFMHKSLINCLAVPLKDNKYDYLDFLNDTKCTWKYPVGGKESNKSVEELYEDAKEEVKELDKLFLLNKENKLTYEDINKFVHQIDHDGNNYKEIKKFQDICWKYKKQ